MKRVVIIEDEPDILELLERSLKKSGMRCFCATDGRTGLEIIRKENPGLIILDLMLPGLNGLDVCRKIKMDPVMAKVPLVILTSKAEESDILLGLGLGADDYITKPFSMRELNARLLGVLRRGPIIDSDGFSHLHYGSLSIDPVGFQVMINGRQVPLTATEFRLLETLARNPNRVFNRDQLLNSAIGENAFVIDRNIDVHIRSIRKKLGDCAPMVETVRGIGYRFASRTEDTQG